MAPTSAFDIIQASIQQKREEARDHVPHGAPNHNALLHAAKVPESEAIAVAQKIAAITARVKAGDLSDLEAMLTEQAVLLNYVAADMTALASSASQMEIKKGALDMALRSQNACRKAILAINEMKNPKRSATFIKQQNNLISGGGTDGGAKMDGRAKSLASSKNPAVEAVAVKHGAEVASR